MKTKRTKDLASSQLQSCFCGDDMLRYRSGGLSHDMRSQIFYHLNVEKCPRCRDLFLTVQGPSRDVSTERPNRPIIDRLKREMGRYQALPVPMRLEKGQIWTTSPEPGDGQGNVAAVAPMAVPVLLVSTGTGERSLQNTIRVLPISNDVGFHLSGETLIIHADSPLGYPFLVELFNESPMLAGNLREYRGSVSDSRFREIQMLRERYFDGGSTVKPDKPYLKWREQEIDMARYLSLPVNAAIWAEPMETGTAISEVGAVQGTCVHIDLMPYKKAADADGMDLSEMRSWVLMDTDSLALALVQKRDQVALRLMADERIPEIFVGDKKAEMDKKGAGLFETVIGHVDSMPQTMSITAVVNGKRFDFQLSIKRGHDA